MSNDTADLNTRLREAENRARTAESAAKNAKGRQIRVAVWSAIGGFLLFAIGGHWFPGYQLDSTAKATGNEMAVSAVSEVMAQLCVERFMSEPDLDSRLAALDQASGNWNKANYIRDGKWAAAPDGARTDHATAEKCRVLIAERVSEESKKTS